jgi:sulfite exporter TauE/SafE/copper chaperone CopZ
LAESAATDEREEVILRQVKQLCSVSGMQCDECALTIEEALQALPGVLNASVDFGSETVNLDFDAETVRLDDIRAAVQKAGYDCKPAVAMKKTGLVKRVLVVVSALLGIAALLSLDKFFASDLSLADLGSKANYGILFLIGILTSFHCIGMCGGFVLGYTSSVGGTMRAASWRHLVYGVGKTLSYSGFGALFGLLGGFVAFSTEMRAVVLVSAGVFLVMYGLSMLRTFSGLRRFHIRMPMFLHRFVVARQRKVGSPFVIGLLNGLMIACGPLQAMYVSAAGTGSALQGGAMLFFFALGTLPVMLAFGFFASLVKAETGRKIVQISAFLIVLLGVMMINRSLMVLGAGYDFAALGAKILRVLPAEWTGLRRAGDAGLLIQNGYQVVYMEVVDSELQPNRFVVKRNYPVKWIINVKKLSSCTSQLVVPSLEKTVDLQPGLQILEFLPEQAGDISWSCNMGMISGSFTVED